MQLSQRLKTIANFVPWESIVSDIGTDHAYLPIYLVTEGICPKAVGGDIHQGPYEAAVRAVNEAGLAGKIVVRLGDGLTILEPGEVDLAVIAGMGGGTIRSILEAAPQVVESLHRLILQPMVDSAHLREWLLLNGWQIIDEELVEEESRLYEIIAAEKADPTVHAKTDRTLVGKPNLNNIMLEVGPKLVENRHPLLHKHLDKLIQDGERVLKQIQNSTSPSAQEKAKQIKIRLAKLRELQGAVAEDIH